MIIEELNRRGTGYDDDQINVKSLYFADDGLLLSKFIDDDAENIQIVTQISRKFGLEINKTKSNIMIFNFKEQPEYIEDIEVVTKLNT